MLREQLIKTLDLVPLPGATEVTDEQIITIVTETRRHFVKATSDTDFEKAVRDLINQSGHALSRDAAVEIVKGRETPFAPNGSKKTR